MMKSPTRNPITMILAAAVFTLSPALIRAQETGVDVMEIARQVRRNMINVEESLLELGGDAAQKSGDQAAKDLEKLVDGKKDPNSGLKSEITRRGEQVVKDMDTMIKTFKSSGGGGGGQPKPEDQKGKGQQGKQQASSRDRNKSEQSGDKPQEPSKPGQKPGQKEEKENSKPNAAKGSNQESGDRKYPNRQKIQHVNLEDRWGILPPEQRQRLIDRNFRDFTPEYEREIRAYFKKIARRR